MDQSAAARITALDDYGLGGSGPEKAFDRLTHLAADLFAAPIAMVTLIDAENRWVKSSFGAPVGVAPRALAFCDHLLPLPPGSVMVVEDLAQDPRFRDHPFVLGPPHLRFYAGAVLTSPQGVNLGAICLVDTKPRPSPSAREQARLADLAAMVVDELELRRASRRAAEAHSLLAMAERMSGVGQWRAHIPTGRIIWSDEVYRLHGLDRDSPLTTAAIIACYHPQDRIRMTQLSRDCVRNREGFEYEVRLTGGDGVDRIVTCKADVILGEDGRVETVFGVFQDVTAQRAAMTTLQRDKSRYKLLADNVGDVITRIRMDGRSGYISPAVFRLLGYRPREMAGRPAQSFVFPPDVPLIMQVFAEMAAGVGERTVQLRAAHRDGHPVWVEVHLKLIRDGRGQPVETVCVIRDITQRKALEAQLLTARAEAEAAAAAKGEFLANMSHELRTPLTSIIGFTRLAAEAPDLGDIPRGYVSRVAEASRALLCTVNDVLDFSKLEAGQVAFDLQPTDLANLGRATLDLFIPQAGAKALSLTLDADPADEALTVLVDPDRLRQILLNLLGNAVKFTDAGGVVLRSRYRRAAGVLDLEVIDTGAGVPMDQQDRLFKRFSQVDGAGARGGTGLGLAICKGLAEAMGGEIGVESSLGGGSRFWLRIPAPLVEARGPAGEAQDEPPAAAPGVRVLVVDDNAANRELARLFLGAVGAEVTEAEDGETAVCAALATPYDVILMDLRMPGMDGVETMRRIRAGPGPNLATPVLAFTADLAGDLQNTLTDQGFTGFVGKPIDPALLIGAVTRAAQLAASPDPRLQAQRVAS